MRILFLTQVLPFPLDAGPKVRAYHVLQYLAARHDVTLVSFTRASDTPDAVARLKMICRQVHTVPMVRTRSADLVGLARSLVSGQPFTITRDERRLMRQVIDDIAGRQPFDAVHADQLSMASYALSACAAQRRVNRAAAPRLVLDAHNAYYLIPGRLARATTNPALKLLFRREEHLTARYEAGIYRRFNHILTVTDQDRVAIQRIMPPGPPAPQWTTVPICEDLDARVMDRNPNARGLLMLGGLHWPPNADAARWFTRDIWPRVREAAPDARLFIVGERPPQDIRALGDFVGIERPDQAGDAPVAVTGYVNDPAPFIRDSAALVVALRSGGGMRVKIIKALQWGLPVVSTSIGFEGIECQPRRDMLAADDPGAFADALIAILGDRALAQRLADHGRQLVEQRYDWRKRYAAFDAIYPPG